MGAGSPEGARGAGAGQARQGVPAPLAPRARGTTWLAMRFDLLTSSLTRGRWASEGFGKGGARRPTLPPEASAPSPPLVGRPVRLGSGHRDRCPGPVLCPAQASLQTTSPHGGSLLGLVAAAGFRCKNPSTGFLIWENSSNYKTSAFCSDPGQAPCFPGHAGKGRPGTGAPALGPGDGGSTHRLQVPF